MKTFLPALIFLFSFSSSFSQIKLDSGLVAYYPFNGNANDESGNGSDPIFNNATLTNDHLGNPNSAYYFNGIDNYIRIPNAPAINPSGQISICVFVKPMGFYKGPCHGNSVLMKGDADFLPGNYQIRFDDNAFTSQNNCNTSVVDTVHQNFYAVGAQTPSPGYSPYISKAQWYCVAYTYDGTNSKFYIDGVLERTETTLGKSFTNSADLFLGKLNATSFPYWFNGVMDEVRIYNREITQDEVSALCPTFALPVTLTKFGTSVTGKQIKLNWDLENASEISNFTIQRSFTGNSDFVELGKILAGNNIHSYSFVDTTAGVNQNYYYRLAILEKGGAISYSEIKLAQILTKNKLVVVYPNPSRGTFTVKINGYSGNAKFTIINPVGQLIMKKSEMISDNKSFRADLGKQLKGVYWLRVETKQEKYITRIIIL